MDKIYLDNGATSFPKAPGVAEAIVDYINNVGGSVSRGTGDGEFTTEHVVYETRELICRLFNFDKPENVIFTKNITESLNVLLKGFLKDGDHVIVSSVEHNAVMRPLNTLSKRGVEITRIQLDGSGQLPLEEVEKAVKENTRLIVMTHSSNVSGDILPIEEVGKIAKANDVRFIVDVAQTAGHLPLDIQKIKADAIAFTGHKGLLGPQGMGGFVIVDDFVSEVEPFIEGGTGSKSTSEEQPEYMPDKFEAGTPNLPGIFGLNAALKYIFEMGIENIHELEMEKMKYFVDQLNQIDGIRLIGNKDLRQRVAVVSIDFKDFDNAMISFELSTKYGISNRCGIHCAPSAHKTYNTYPQGTVRLSLSHFTKYDELDKAVNAIRTLIGQ